MTADRSTPTKPGNAKPAQTNRRGPRSTRFWTSVQSLGPAATAGQRGRLIFALDATMSRQPTWDTACRLQAEMFREAAAIGGLDVQLVYFRGLGECRASRWVSDSDRLGELMERIDCRGGHTQIGKVLSARPQRESSSSKVQALVFVGDAMEEADRRSVRGGGRARPARRAGVHVPGGRRRGRRAGVPRDRAADARRLLPLRRRRGA